MEAGGSRSDRVVGRGAARVDETLEENVESLGIAGQIAGPEKAGAEQRVVQFVGVARIRPGLVAHALDRSSVEAAEVVRRRRLARAARLHGLRPPLLERGVVEKCIGPRIDDLVRERGRLGGVARHQTDLPW